MLCRRHKNCCTGHLFKEHNLYLKLRQILMFFTQADINITTHMDAYASDIGEYKTTSATIDLIEH